MILLFQTKTLSDYQIYEISSYTDDKISDWAEVCGMGKGDARWFAQARNEAFKSDFHTAKLGCVLVYKNHILSVGHNKAKTDPVQRRYNTKYRAFTRTGAFIQNCGHTIHAEMDALKTVPYPIAQQVEWKNVNVYVYRVGWGLDDYTGLALPCPACAHALSDIGIRHVYYTTGHDDMQFGHCDI